MFFTFLIIKIQLRTPEDERDPSQTRPDRTTTDRLDQDRLNESVTLLSDQHTDTH